MFKFKYNGQYQFSDSAGVYAILNTLNNKKYVGSSSSIRRGYRQHYNDLVKGKHSNIILQRAFDKYGKNHFKFIILEKCEDIKDTLMAIEQKYIDSDGDYNICKVAGKTTGVHNTGHVISDQHKKIIAESNKNRVWSEQSLTKKSDSAKNSDKLHRKAVLQYDLNGNFIKEFRSLADAALSLGNINRRVNIKRCCQNKQNVAYNYIWRFKNDK